METTTGSSGASSLRSGDRLRRKLAAIVLGFETMVVVFATLLSFGLQLVPAPAVWWLGGTLFVLVIIASGAVRRGSAGFWLGWLVQLVLLAAGLLNVGILIIALIFVAMWVYVFVAAARADAQASELLEARPTDTNRREAERNER